MVKVTKEHIEKLMTDSSYEVKKMGQKTTIVACTLPNGFVVVESSSCVDPVNYDQELGTRIAKKRIETRLWELEGYKNHG